MPRFKFSAMNAKGAETEGVLDAASQSEAITLIRSKGLFPTRVEEMEIAGAKASAPGSKSSGSRAGMPAAKGLKKELKMPKIFEAPVRTKHLMIVTRQMATLIQAGLPLLRGLRILLQQEKHPVLRRALAGMGEAVEGGSTFSEALAMFPKIFDNLFINMIRAGEAGGVMDVALQRLAEFMEKAEKIKRKVKGAMVYPIVVLVVAIGILIFLLVKIIPSFAEIFDDLLGGKGLPALTQFVMNCSEFVRDRWYVVVVTISVLVVAVKIACRYPKGRFAFDMLKLRAPLFGDLVLKSSVARFARTLGTLMTSGVPVLQALNIVRDTAGNAVVAQAIQGIHDAVKEGDSMTMPMEASKVFPGMVVSMVDVGEETGALPDMLVRIADNYDDEVDTAVEALTSIIEPVMIVLLALIVGTIVIAMFVPLIAIIGGIEGG
ncbi:MAG: type II secretion system F family protein [Verrucomicrobia bacterium]|nr:type II secretion system F family protein [Verrucomicrobiota bacterium]